MAHAPEKVREARRLFVVERMALPSIEVAIGVKASTVSRWKRKAKAGGDDWDLARKACLVAGEGLGPIMAATAERFVSIASQQMERIDALREIESEESPAPEKIVSMLASLADSMTKAVGAAGRLAPHVTQLGVAQDVLARMADFVEREFPEHAPAFLEILEPFGAELTAAYGG